VRNMKSAYRNLVGKPERQRPLRSPRFCWEGNPKIDLKEMGWEGVNWIYLAQDITKWRSVVNTAVNLELHIMSGI
jgi:hypothetical protein